MIKNSKDMVSKTNPNDVNRDFLKGKMLFNGSPRNKVSQFGIVKGFYISNGRRLFVVETLTDGKNTNWWLDLSNGKTNEYLYLIEDSFNIKFK